MTFPEDFLWGAATSAYQVEGAADLDGRGRSNWDAFCERPGAIYRNDNARKASDHYHHLESDLDLMSELGLNAYRFSVSWTRIIPEPNGKVNAKGLAFYERLIDGLLERNIAPFVTINHMELPLYLEEKQGWLNRDSIQHFVDYAQVLHGAFSDRVTYWTTLNEIALTTWWGYGTQMFPPALNDVARVMPAIHHQLVAHGRAVKAMRQDQPDGQFGIVGSYWPCSAAEPGADHQAAANKLDLLINRSCIDVLVDKRYPQDLLDWHESVGGQAFIRPGDLDDLGTPLDYFGLNYYGPVQVVSESPGAGGAIAPPNIGVRQKDDARLPKTRFEWVIDPEPLAGLLRTFRDRYRLPVYVTENGAAFDDYIAPDDRVRDRERIDYLQSHLIIVERALEEGVDLRGYMAWSLLDNFEWAAGYSKRFGLVYVEYGSQRRRPKDSFHWYRSLIDSVRAGGGIASAGRAVD